MNPVICTYWPSKTTRWTLIESDTHSKALHWSLKCLINHTCMHHGTICGLFISRTFWIFEEQRYLWRSNCELIVVRFYKLKSMPCVIWRKGRKNYTIFFFKRKWNINDSVKIFLYRYSIIIIYSVKSITNSSFMVWDMEE
jgi:hypothetical protein